MRTLQKKQTSILQSQLQKIGSNQESIRSAISTRSFCSTGNTPVRGYSTPARPISLTTSLQNSAPTRCESVNGLAQVAKRNFGR